MNKDLKQLQNFTLHVRNCADLGPHPLRAEATLMTALVNKIINEHVALKEENEELHKRLLRAETIAHDYVMRAVNREQ